MRNSDGTYNEVLFTARDIKPEIKSTTNKASNKPGTTAKVKRNKQGKAHSTMPTSNLALMGTKKQK